jgi:glyoxylase-like metal-dependent hydrolase (beta-lactamase superfamily II)
MTGVQALFAPGSCGRHPRFFNREGKKMHAKRLTWFVAPLLLSLGMARAQAPATPPPAATPPPYATTKVADNVYVFRYAGHQSMFVVTPEGVIATDPIALGRPQAAVAYVEEIRKITQAPIKYVVYSHHHYDHITGGKPFKDAGATFIAHRNAKAHLEKLKEPNTIIPDEVVDDRRVLELGGTRLELIYTGRNHSDNSLVMLLPKEKILFAVDFLPVQALQFREMPDTYVPDFFDSIDRVLALDWDRMIPGHPAPGGRLGTKDDVRAARQYLVDVSDAAKDLAAKGQCLNDDAMRAVKLPKYESWGAYNTYLFGNVERFCYYWARGY